MMETFLWAQSVALTEQGHASERTLLLDPADADAASGVTAAWRLGETHLALAVARFGLAQGLTRLA